MIGIYKITNLLNNKIYIGRSVNIKKRWQEHCKPSTYSIIGKAIKTYGKNNFLFEVIEECSKEELEEKEKHWISFYNCFIPNGYNVLDETKNNITNYGFIDKDKIDKIIQELMTNIDTPLSQIAKKYDVYVSTISRINNGEVHHKENLCYPLRPTSFNYGKKIQKQPREPKLKDEEINLELVKEILNTSFTATGKKYGYKSGSSLQLRLKNYGFPHTKKQLQEYYEKQENVSELV